LTRFAFAYTISGCWIALMSAGDALGLSVALLVLGYLVYALFRGEKL
jgi:hypothetical protein